MSERIPFTDKYSYDELKDMVINIGNYTKKANLSDSEVIELLKVTEGLLAGQMKKIEKKSEGGLLDEGGEKDPVSGNDVPAGSTKKEVRDDIPAQLSEGEFVFPADVVRYLGLDFLMKLRQKAKAGLQRMEAMGQMGNSEEATLPDDIPFTLDDLDVEEDGRLNFSEGGTPNEEAGEFGRPLDIRIPEDYGPDEASFDDLMGGSSFGKYDELRKFVGPNGEIRYIPFKDGEPLPPYKDILEGLTEKGYTYTPPGEEEEKPPEEQQVGTTQPVETEDKEKDRQVAKEDKEQRERGLDNAVQQAVKALTTPDGKLPTEEEILEWIKGGNVKAGFKNKDGEIVGIKLPGFLYNNVPLPGQEFGPITNAINRNKTKGQTEALIKGTKSKKDALKEIEKGKPGSDQDLNTKQINYFEQFKQSPFYQDLIDNPRPTTTVIGETTLPSGETIQTSTGAETQAFRQYLDSIGIGYNDAPELQFLRRTSAGTPEVKIEQLDKLPEQDYSSLTAEEQMELLRQDGLDPQSYETEDTIKRKGKQKQLDIRGTIQTRKGEKAEALTKQELAESKKLNENLQGLYGESKEEIANLNKLVEDKNKEIADKNSQIANKDAQINKSQQQIQEQNNRISQLSSKTGSAAPNVIKDDRGTTFTGGKLTTDDKGNIVKVDDRPVVVQDNRDDEKASNRGGGGGGSSFSRPEPKVSSSVRDKVEKSGGYTGGGRYGGFNTGGLASRKLKKKKKVMKRGGLASKK